MMFKDSFKYYKSRVPPPDFDEVVDFKRVDFFSDKVKILEPHQVEANEFPLLLRPVSEWKIFELIDKPGLLFVENPWTEVGVRYWVCRSLQQLTRPPSKLNIDHDDHRGACLNIEHNDHRAAWWDEAQLKRSQDGGALLRRLRWATFGYHHNWDTKEYSEQNKCAFPEDLAAVCRYVADAVGGWSEFAAQAAILNFYHPDSTLSGHRDHSEPNMQAPLLSFSFGQSAIFLVGGLTLDERPRAVFVDNGDVMIMSAASRLVYHGVPRIVTSRHHLVPPCSISADNGAASAILNGELLNCILNDDNDRFWRPFCDYVSQSRINMNVRQVLCSGQTSL